MSNNTNEETIDFDLGLFNKRVARARFEMLNHGDAVFFNPKAVFAVATPENPLPELFRDSPPTACTSLRGDR